MCDINASSVVALLVVLLPGVAAFAADSPAVVSDVKVVSNKVPDVSSLDAWKTSVLNPGMSDREKAIGSITNAPASN